MVRGDRALPPAENSPTAHRARARWRRGVVVFVANALRAPPHAVDRGTYSPTPRQVGSCGFETSSSLRATFVKCGARALRPVENRPTARRVRARWLTLRGYLCNKRATRSTQRRWPRLFFTDTVPGRRPRLGNVIVSAFVSRAARPARVSPRGETADGPRSTLALADLAWLSSRPTHGSHMM